MRFITMVLLGLFCLPLFAETIPENTPDAGMSNEDLALEAKRLRGEFQKARLLQVEAGNSPATETKSLDLSHWGPLHPLSGTQSLWTSMRADGQADFLSMRGVDAGQGREIGIAVDGVPINLPNHVSSQGYADLHFIIPELVENVTVSRGTLSPSTGDFAAVGAVDIEFRHFLPENAAILGSGMDQTFRGLAIASAQGDWRPLVAAEFFSTAGPYQNTEGLKRYNLFARFTHPLDSHGTELSLTFMGHSSDWSDSGYLPNRAVAEGIVSSLGSLDPSQGGSSQRYSGVARFTTKTARDQTLTLTTYATRSEFSVFSNESFFDVNPVNGDEREGIDDRMTLGVNGLYRIDQRNSEIGFDTLLGVQARGDFGSRTVYSDQDRIRLSNLVNDDIQTKTAAAFAQQEIYWTKWLKTTAAIRGEYLAFNLQGQTMTASHALAVDGSDGVLVASPRTGIVVTPTKNIDVYLRTGLSYHTNDAKAVLLAGDINNYLTRIVGYEMGVHGKNDRLDWEVTGFYSGIGQETNFDPLYETVLIIPPSSRLGIEARAQYHLLDWLSVEATATINKAHLDNATPGNDAVPFAPTRMATASLIARHPRGYFGRFGLTSVGSRPATSDGSLTAQGFVRCDALLGYRAKSFEITLAALNLFNTQWQELQTVGASRLSSETAAVQDINFIAGTPLNIQASASIFF